MGTSVGKIQYGYADMRIFLNLGTMRLWYVNKKFIMKLICM